MYAANAFTESALRLSLLESVFPEEHPLTVIKYGGELENASAIKSCPLAFAAAFSTFI